MFRLYKIIKKDPTPYVQETLNQLLHFGKEYFSSWEVDGFALVENSVRFHAKSFDQWFIVNIAYNQGSDLYDITFYKMPDWEETSKLAGIYFEDMATTIDEFLKDRH